MPDEIPYQQAPQVAQLLAHRETAMAYGQTDLVASAEKQLRGLGWVDPAKAAKARAAAAAKEEEAGEGGEARSKPPEGRATRARQTTTEGSKSKT